MPNYCTITRELHYWLSYYISELLHLNSQLLVTQYTTMILAFFIIHTKSTQKIQQPNQSQYLGLNSQTSLSALVLVFWKQTSQHNYIYHKRWKKKYTSIRTLLNSRLNFRMKRFNLVGAPLNTKLKPLNKIHHLLHFFLHIKNKRANTQISSINNTYFLKIKW